jgi:hypothetical protein
MFVVTEADAAAIRAIFNQEGELSVPIELRRRFPGITDNAKARVGTADYNADAGRQPVQGSACDGSLSPEKTPPPHRTRTLRWGREMTWSIIRAHLLSSISVVRLS